MKKIKHIGKAILRCFLFAECRFLFKCFFIVVLVNVISGFDVKAQDIYTNENEKLPFTYDEIPVLVMVEGAGNFNLDVLYTNNDKLFVNVEDLFKTLDIQCIVGQRGDSLGGFIENRSRVYLIDFSNKQVIVENKLFNTPDDLIKENGSLYMESTLFAEAFGIILTFNYRSLSILLKSNFELPVIKQMRIEKFRNNLSKIKMEEVADTMVDRNYHLFRFGTFDWSVTSTQKWNESFDNRFILGLGTEFLYGEADISYTKYNQKEFNTNQLQYLWRWVDNDKKLIKQAQFGKIATQSISFIISPVIGAVVRNSPTTVRKATGYYTINEYTEPNWTIELYINNILVDYTKSDASGLYIFKVPIVYGYNTLKLKFYGPLGEERTEERTMNVPYTVMPANEFEYGISAGVVQDSSLSHYGRGECNYGLNSKFTIGGGMEYLSSIPNGPFIPFLKATFQPFSKLTINGEYAYGVKTNGLLNYYFSKDILLEIDYTKYVEGQLATRFNSLEDRKARLSVPFRFKKVSGYVKLEYSQLVYSEFNYNQTNAMFSASYKQFSGNSSLQLNWIDKQSTYVTTDLALSYRFGNGIILRPSARYNISEKEIVSYKAEIAKRIPRGYLSASYERNVLFDDNFLTISFKYDLPFARTNVSSSQSKNKISTAVSAQGSLAFGSGNGTIHVSNNSSLSKGGILLYPFLDVNQNGIFDSDEHIVSLSKVRINGGRAVFNEKDSIIRIPELNAFASYNLSFNDNDLPNIAWRFKNKIFKVLIDPNQFKRVDIPIVSVGEISGMVYKDKGNSLKGIGRILIKFYKKNSSKVIAETLSESDGYIYYLGLEPGDYVACIDSVQLRNLDLEAQPSCIDFSIEPKVNGDIFEGIDFVLRAKQNKLINDRTPASITNSESNAVGKNKLPILVTPAEPAEQNSINLQ